MTTMDATSGVSSYSDGSTTSDQDLSADTAQQMAQALSQLLELMEKQAETQDSANSTAVGDTGLSVTGNLDQDMTTLKKLVDGTGTNGNTLQEYARAVASEASNQSDGIDSSVATNIANSLSDGTYEQGGSSNAIAAAIQGKSVDAITNNVNSIASGLESGQSGTDEVNNFNALATEASNAGNTQLAQTAKNLASEAESGSFNSSSAVKDLEAAIGESSDTSTSAASSASSDSSTQEMEGVAEEMAAMISQLMSEMKSGGSSSS